ncbi:SCF ubiquitin ligase complex subunit cdc4 [Saxophila tyrrhenica]|uniref:SCF ubiquitin ligase complex subunit cdc4 n=1 Tax=Saxophila tyrrhenica TaxID=1690608 RepID=A0AAV9PLT9_9PEZI|nr:SCF ubiquitin ligase complex subunit cdc4 [Saxophila tyrrhenica]
MEAPRNHGLGLKTDPAMNPEAILSTAPASPTEEQIHHKPPHLMEQDNPPATTTNMAGSRDAAPSHATVAQMSYGPATQQTVTTVTTTTTVTLPPLIMKPPKNLYERDLKQYPLAFTPTPSYLKRFSTDVHGRPIRFQEEEDAQRTVKDHHELQENIRRHNGSMRSEAKQDDYRTPVRVQNESQLGRGVHNVRASKAPKRTATPPSIAEAAELASLHRKIKKPRSQLQRTRTELGEHATAEQRATSGSGPPLSNPSPVTPDTDVGLVPPQAPKTSGSQASRRRRSPVRPSQSRLQELQYSDSEPQDEDSLLGPPFYGRKGGKKTNSGEDTDLSGDSQLDLDAGSLQNSNTDAEQMLMPPSRRPNLPTLLTSSQQDASLPSPSLSPITAAANLASRQNAFEASFGEAVSAAQNDSSRMDIDPGTMQTPDMSFTSQPKNSSFGETQSVVQSQPGKASQSNSGPTVMDIPTMVDAFDGMPEAMQSYLIYQFLRRCSKPTLQMVANVVNPALKCDPFSVLPVELGLNIIRYLDVQSMCRAAQVSKRWRRHINFDEKAWQDLLKRDGFVLPEGEIVRAIKEGWGWQHPGEDGYEEDLSRRMSRASPEYDTTSPADAIVVSDDEDTASSSVPVRAKRKSMAKHSSSSKKLKRRSVQVQASATKPSASTSGNRIHRLLASHTGPNALAQAAAQAVPYPSSGLPSLKSMHLFKSLYQRHYLIRKSWMSEESNARHLAFRAHHRHVVTCLLFDSEKILTGSDDTKINVYDTKTGALKNRLEGHEGGVWALQYEGDTLVSGSTDRSVRVWDIKSGRCLQVFQGHTSTVRCLVILKPVEIGRDSNNDPIMMPKEPLIITGSRDSTLRVWKLPKPGEPQVYHAGPPANDRDNPYFLRTLSGHHNSVRAIAAHGDTLISGSYDCTVRVWKISNGELLQRLQGHTQKVYSVVLDQDRARCISGSMDNLVKVWDLESGTCLFSLEGHTSLVGLLDLSHDRLVSAAADSTLRIWDPDTGACKATLSAHTGAITCFQHDGQKVISGSDRTLKMWNVKNGECVRDLLTDLSGVWQVRFDERRCVAAVQRNNLTYIEVLDFGAARDGVPASERGRRVVVNVHGKETLDVDVPAAEPDAAAAQ